MVDAVVVVVTRTQVELEQQIKGLGEVLVYRWHPAIQVVAVGVVVVSIAVLLAVLAVLAS
jgi:hypothetical protein